MTPNQDKRLTILRETSMLGIWEHLDSGPWSVSQYIDNLPIIHAPECL